MPTDHRAALAKIRRFDQLIAYLRDEMGWPIARDSFEDVDDLFYDFTADELGIDPKTAAKIQEIKRLRPLSPRQPWGIFFVKFEPKKLPVVALRRILSQVALKKRTSANSAERAAWAADDLLFVSNYGEGDERQISFAHFSKAQDGHDLPTLKVLGWDNLDTALHLDAVARELTQHLAWPEDDANVEAWRDRWRAAFTLRHREVVTTSKDLSIRLAELARAIRDRIKTALAIETERGPLTNLMKAFQEALVHDLDAVGFADMYAQTIAYGLLSARIADPHKKTADDFAGHMRTNPFLRELMETFLKVGGRRGKAGGPGIDFDELGVSEVVELLDDANMEAVVRNFGDKNPQEDPVIHFYEHFLAAYDKKQKVQRGVFYTPRPVVSYIVRSVDELLRTEFGLGDGLADTTTWGEMARRHQDLKLPESVSPDQAFVQILDPATGTGTFLVEVIDLIHSTLAAKWKAKGHDEKKVEAFWNEYVPKHLLPRLHGYELLMAPYAIAHLKIGLKLYETGYRFGSDERARIYLTNSLEPASDSKKQMEFKEWIPALAHEAQAVNEIKRRQRFTVVLGNPPYASATANRSRDERGNLTFIGGLIERYKEIGGVRISERNPKVLQDDYVKFLRFAEWCVARAGYGAVGMITNSGYLDNPTFGGMRESFLNSFNFGQVVDLHGNMRRTESPPLGQANENVFDIQQGVAIGLWCRSGSHLKRELSHCDLWGTRAEKAARLLDAGTALAPRRHVIPGPPFYLFVPQSLEEGGEWSAQLPIQKLFQNQNVSLVTHRDDFVIDFDRSVLELRIEEFRDSSITDRALAQRYGLHDNRDWSLREARRTSRQDKNWRERITPCLYRPFDTRWAFLATYAMDFPRLGVMEHLLRRNVALVTTRQATSLTFNHVFVSRYPVEFKCVSHNRNCSTMPLYRYDRLLDGDSARISNLFPGLLQRVGRLVGLRPINDGVGDLIGTLGPDGVLHYAYAQLHSPGYRSRYAEFLKIEFPRLLLASSLVLFRDLARLGGELVALHLLESPKVNESMSTYTGPTNPQVGRVGWSDDTVWLDAAATKKGPPAGPGTIGFRGVPEAVWNFHIGGYQVCEKWLKDRKGRTLSKDDIAHYQKIVVALAETIRLMKEIDEVIESHGGWPGAFQSPTASQEPAEPARKVAEPRGEYGPGSGEGKKD